MNESHISQHSLGTTVAYHLTPGLAFLGVSQLLGPNPTGLIGMSGLLVGAVILLWKMSATAQTDLSKN